MAPVSFVRQVLAVCLYPELFRHESLPLDVKLRAKRLLGGCGGGCVGSYSVTSCGLPLVQQSVAEFIMRRDGGVSSNPEEIILSNGSESSLSLVLHLMASGEGETQTGVLTPIPCSHTLPMLLDEAGVMLVPYQLREDRGWAVDLEELHRALKTARGRCKPRAIYISNPGNPTGFVQNRKTIKELIQFAAAERLILLADEVHQDSVYGQGREFISYKKVLFEMGKEYSETVELVSFHSISSACMGECGLRGGYMEIINMDPTVFKYLRNLLAYLSPTVLPQLVLEIMVNPPTPGDPSYKTYTQTVHSEEIMMKVALVLLLAAYAHGCGTPTYEPSVSRVVSGVDARPYSWPWQISLQYLSGSTYRHTCGGTLLAPNWIMTAGHCISPRTYRVVLGEYDLTTEESFEQIRSVEKIVVHPNWNDNCLSCGNDVAMIKLSSPVTLNDKVQPACMPQSGDIVPHDDPCYITGWGRIYSKCL
eukprot:superscaffoldBa00003751_g17615